MNLATRITLLLLVLSTLPLGVVSWLAYRSGRQAIESDAIHHLTSTNILKQTDLDRWIANNEQSLRELARRSAIGTNAAVLSALDPGRRGYQTAYRAILEEFGPTMEEEGGFIALSIIHRETGIVLVSTEPELEGKYRESESYYLEGRTGTYSANASYSLSLQQVVMHTATPVNDADGDLVAVLAGCTDLAEMSEIVGQRTGLSDSEETYLVNTFNFLVTQPRLGDDNTLTQAVRTEGVEDCLNGNDGAGFYEDYRGVPVIGAYHWIEERGLCILTEVDQDEAYASVDSLRATATRFSIVVGAVVVVAGYLLSRTITGPVRRLVRGAEEIGRGNLAHRIPVSGQDEIAQLAVAFNVMAANLRQSLGETGYSERLLLALGQAAEDVQRARTPEEVLSAVADGLAALGFTGSILTLTEDGSHFAMPQLTFDSGIVRAAERLVGLSRDTYRIPIEPGGIWHKRTTEPGGEYYESFSKAIAEALPRGLRQLAPRIASMMGIEQSIVARLSVGGEPYGVLVFQGPGISEADVPAVTAFANQTSIALENALAAQKMRQHSDQLEEMVEHRTADLQNANVELEAEVAVRKRTGAALRALTTRYEAILAAAPDIIVEVDNETIYTWANQAGFAFFGDDVIGKEASFYFEGEQDTYNVAQPLLEGGEDVIYIENWQRRKDGEKRLLAWWCRSLLDTAGVVSGVLSTARDITGQRESAEELREYSERLEQMVMARTRELVETQDQLLRHERLAVLGQLAGGVGHELRNPLGAIKSAAYFLGMAIEDPEPEVQQTLEILNREVAASDKIIGTLLDYARPKTASRRTTDVNEVVREALARTEVPDGVKVAHRLSRSLPPVMADPDQLGQVFGNIIRNAFQAMPDGGRLTVKTTSSTEAGPGRDTVAASFRDTGTGISEMELHKVFEPLFTTKAKGIGLGLALSRMLIDAHGGSIGVTSEEGKGSTFTVTLPLSTGA